MALKTFNVKHGLSINDNVQIREGASQPTGDALTEAVIGSIWLEHTADNTVFVWQRFKSDTNTVSDWRKLASEEYVDNALAATISWREPAKVLSTDTALPASTVNTIDGVTITDGMRVLFTDAALNNVFIASGSAGSWTWTEDDNQETAGDTLYIEEGTYAGTRYTYTSAGTWVRTDQSSLDELQAIRTFIGKDASGTESPNYSSTNVVTQGGSLETAIGELDAGVQAVDNKIGANVTDGEVILSTNTVNQNLQAIDTWIGDNGKEITLANVSTSQVVDTIPAGKNTAKWAVQLSDASGYESCEIFAVSNGTLVDHTEYAVVYVGNGFTNKSITVTVSGTGEMQLNIASSGRPANVVVRRLVIM